MRERHHHDRIVFVPLNDVAILLAMTLLWKRRERLETELLRMCDTDMTCSVGRQKVEALDQWSHFSEISEIIDAFDD